MRKRTWLVVFVALAVIALAIAALPAENDSSADAGSASVRAELERLKHRLDDETAERARAIARLEAQLRAVAHADAARGSSAAVAVTAPTEVGEPTEQAEPVTPSEHLEGVFAEQPRDDAWAHAAEDTIESRLSAHGAGAKLQSVECHASLCRVEVRYQDTATYHQLAGSTLKDPNKRVWAGDSFSVPTEGAQGELIVVSYLAREGEPLPPMR